ncbi:hypothetical protein BGW38_001282 [Lunasporangiospora selenospora]|uniref:BTB domain-containing protein n=1 Tax=Lunasporangiospora selenospora TaxID=979761 RepID=A0A9P6KIW3_9FUNG|nr:hypothetical protein BGW38_001282 [Lunasporangiospora selenospora]
MWTSHGQVTSGNSPVTYSANTTISKAATLEEVDINLKCENGTTQLHRAVADNDLQLVRSILRHPKLDVNAKDLESGWTALHRAMYHGHLRIAIALLQHKDSCKTVEDKERNTALDVFLATVPTSLKAAPCPAEALYTWGSNANFTLGHSDSDNRKIPELVKFPYRTSTITLPRVKTARSLINHVSMSKFHVAVATSEPGHSVKVWGFGTGGRLGSDIKMQLRPTPLPSIYGEVSYTALGRDHTVLVTSKGEVYTLGNNKYGQLGYVMDTPKNSQDPVQRTPKRVVATISGIHIKGAAASKWHTVVFSDAELFTFGFNYGQLGYERKGDIQVLPRRVASLPQGSILEVSASDTATACLMSSNDVVVFHKYAYHKVSFSLSPYPEGFASIRLPSVVSLNRPQRITSSENKFGILTRLGDIHVWSYPEADPDITLGSLPHNHTIPYSPTAPYEKPRRVWTCGSDQALTIDFALGHNGSVILTTKRGHVYIGINKGSVFGRNIKWQRAQHLDRIVQVYSSPSESWAALRSESTPTPIYVRPGRLGQDLEQSLTQFHLYRDIESDYDDTNQNKEDAPIHDEDDESDTEEDPWRIDSTGWQDIERSWDHDVMPLLEMTSQLNNTIGSPLSGGHLFDVEIQAGKRTLGAHRAILSARSSVLCMAFQGHSIPTALSATVTIEPNLEAGASGVLFTVSLHVEFATAVLLLQFLYGDRFDPFWNGPNLSKTAKTYSLKVRQELQRLALALNLPTLHAALQYTFTHSCSASLSDNLHQLLQNLQQFRGISDVRLLLRDGSMDLHQVILGHRSPFFNAMFVRTEEWIRSRQVKRRSPWNDGPDETKILEVNMTHMDMEPMALVMNHVYTDSGPELFDSIEKDSMDELIQVIVNVLQIADELAMDRLKEICEYVLGEQVRAKNVVQFLEIALVHGANSLKDTCIDYLCDNIEMALDQWLLEDVEEDVLTLLEDAIKRRQNAFLPWVRNGGYLPDSDKVQAMREKIKLNGPQYFCFSGDFAGEPSFISVRSVKHVVESSDTHREHHQITSLHDEYSGHQEAPAASGNASSVPTNLETSDIWPELSPIPATGKSAPSSQMNLQERTGPLHQGSQSNERPIDGTEDLASSARKSSWTSVSRLDSFDDIGNDRLEKEEGHNRPSLRDILEQEQQQVHGEFSHKSSASSTSATRAPKLSQKERRKLQQQQASANQSQSPQPAPTPQAWAKIPLPEQSPETHKVDLSTGKASTLPITLLEFQHSDVSVLQSPRKSIPRVSVATSMPVKETINRSIATERSHAEAPWKMDAKPRLNPATSRSRQQPSNALSSPAEPTSTGSKSHLAMFPPLSSEGSSAESTPLPALTEKRASPNPFSSMPLQHHMLKLPTASGFASIQSQQLRDRNMLYLARNFKKSLHQIQIEEQAISQIRVADLDRLRMTRDNEGAGEWCTIAFSTKTH